MRRMLLAVSVGVLIALALSAIGFFVLAALGLPAVNAGLLSLLGLGWILVGGMVAGWFLAPRRAWGLAPASVCGVASGVLYIFVTLFFRRLTRGFLMDIYVVEELVMDATAAGLAGGVGGIVGGVLRPASREVARVLRSR